jgi:hypothetical protein
MGMQHIPTVVNTTARFIGVNSPFFVNVTSAQTFTAVRLRLWVWSGALTAPYTNGDDPNVVIVNEKVSASDTYVQFELADYIKDVFNPTFQYQDSTVPIINNECVFFKWEYDIINNPDGTSATIYLVDENISSQTYVGTQGYYWNYETQPFGLNENTMSFGFEEMTQPYKVYNPGIKYDVISGVSLSATNTANVFSRSKYEPTLNETVCPKENWLIIYLDKRGLFQYFTPTGKVVISEKIDREQYTKTFRRPDLYNNSLTHQIRQLNRDVTSSFIVNTGPLKEKAGQYVEEILYSKSVYLMEFKAGAEGYFDVYRTIPVIVTDTDFGRKTRLNDKSKISYNIKFEATTNKIKDIR